MTSFRRHCKCVSVSDILKWSFKCYCYMVSIVVIYHSTILTCSFIFFNCFWDTYFVNSSSVMQWYIEVIIYWDQGIRSFKFKQRYQWGYGLNRLVIERRVPVSDPDRKSQVTLRKDSSVQNLCHVWNEDQVHFQNIYQWEKWDNAGVKSVLLNVALNKLSFLF